MRPPPEGGGRRNDHCGPRLGELRDADPKSVARTRALLAPIDNFRARQSTSSAAASKPEATPTPDEPPLDEPAPAELS